MSFLAVAERLLLRLARQSDDLVGEVAELRKRLDAIEGPGVVLSRGNLVPGMFCTPAFPYVALGNFLGRRISWEYDGGNEFWIWLNDPLYTETIPIMTLNGIMPLPGMIGWAIVVAEGAYQSVGNEVSGLPATLQGIASDSTRAYYWYRHLQGGGVANAFAYVTPRCNSSADAGLAYESSRHAYDSVIVHREPFPLNEKVILQFPDGVPTFAGAAEAQHVNCVIGEGA